MIFELTGRENGVPDFIVRRFLASKMCNKEIVIIEEAKGE